MGKLKELFKKTYVKVLAILLAVALLCGAAIGLMFIKATGKPSDYVFTPQDEYKLSDGVMTVELQKEVGKDFKVLNFTDMHFNDLWFRGRRDSVVETVKALVEKEKPDLITVSGDSIWTLPLTRGALKDIIELFDGFGIPWAPIMGNHEADGNADIYYVADRFAEAEHCLFLKGAGNLSGAGNYIINITENGRLVHALFMMDSLRYRKFPEFKDTKYDYISAGQMLWYQWGVEGINAYNGDGKPVETTVIFHIPVPEFEEAYNAWEESGFDPAMGFGSKEEDVCDSPRNSGFFDFMVKLGSTKNVLVGHDHINNYSVVYKGIRLTYSLKTGSGAYWNPEKNGGTKLTLDENGVMSVEHVYHKYSKA